MAHTMGLADVNVQVLKPAWLEIESPDQPVVETKVALPRYPKRNASDDSVS
jgi:hypothetical protein